MATSDSASSSQYLVRLVDVTKRLGRQRVLRGVNLEIRQGEKMVIIGRSGGGKSVLLKHVLGLMQPDSGQVWFRDKDLAQMTDEQMVPLRKETGMLFQNGALFDSMTVGENVAFPLQRKGQHTPGEISRLVARTLDVVGLPGTEKKKPAELSGGMRKRVGLARAIIYEPRILLYDEPTTGLDPIVSDSIDNLIIRVRERLKVTSVVVTHDMRSARRVGQRILMLHERQIYASGTPEEFFASRDPVVRQFIDGVADPEDILF